MRPATAVPVNTFIVQSAGDGLTVSKCAHRTVAGVALTPRFRAALGRWLGMSVDGTCRTYRVGLTMSVPGALAYNMKRVMVGGLMEAIRA